MTAKPVKPSVNLKKSSPPARARVRKDFPDPQRRLDRLYGRLGITAEQMEGVAHIVPLLKRAGLTHQRVVEILAGDASPEAQKFVAVYRRLSPSDANRVSMEAVALAAGLTTRRLWEVLSGAAMQQGRDVVALMVSVAQPEVVARTIQNAKTEKGYIDREHLYKAVGFLPVSKGQQIFIHAGRVEEKEPEEDTDGTGSLPKMDDFLLDVQRAISPAKTALPALLPKTEDADFVDLPPGRLE